MDNGGIRNTIATLALVMSLALGGCGIANVINPAFANTLFGGVVPVTPGPNAAYVLVLGVNETDETVRFIVTIERNVIQLSNDGVPQIDENGLFLLTAERETVTVCTAPTSGTRSFGTLFPCGASPVTLVGLGDNLLPTDRHVLVGGDCSTQEPGTGVTVPSLNPLQLADGNFNCGDTVIFQAFEDNNVAGNVSVSVFLLPGSEQPSVFSGPNTFANLAEFQAAQSRDEE